MLDGLFMLLILSTVMAIASFLAGSLPLSFSLSQSRLRLVSTIGMGVLVGTSLIVIIPEGVDTLYSASESSHTHIRRATPSHQQLQLGPRAVRLRQDVNGAATDPSPFNSVPGPVIPNSPIVSSSIPEQDPPHTPTAPGEVGIMNSDTTPSTPSSLPSTSEEPIKSLPPAIPESRTPHAWIGISLIFGFILMYLLDTLPLLSPSPPPRPSQNIYSLSDLSSSPPPSSATTSQRPFSTTLGLCIHAAADGIALGASHSSGSTTSLGLIIFLAIMIHKAPASFGLTSVLLKQGLGKRSARAHLVVFSLAAPAGAVATWVVVRTLGGGAGEESNMRFWTGVLLLFSGGTFLYVAMHTMQESDTSSPTEEGFGNGYLEGGGHGRDMRQGGGARKRSLKLVAAAVGGMLLPLVTQIGHAH